MKTRLHPRKVLPQAVILAFLAIGVLQGYAQSPTSLAEHNASAFLAASAKTPKPQVLLVGTFHFNYPNLDSHVTDSSLQVYVKSAARQQELKDLQDYIARFKPTQIVVERRDGSTINDRYRQYLSGTLEDIGKGEIHQLAFPLAKRFGIDSLVIGDDTSLLLEWYNGKDSTTLRPFLDQLFDGASIPGADTTMGSRYFELYDFEDKRDAKATLLENFHFMNRPDRVKMGHGHYLLFTTEQEEDALAINWYSRNLRIYQRIAKAANAPGERVLVLFGAGHLGILTQQLESDPRFEVVRFGDL